MTIASKIFPLAAIAAQFQIEGRFLDAAPWGGGHINDTYVSRFQVDGQVVRYTHQRINHYVFRQPDWVMDNIRRVTEHLRRRVLAQGGDPRRETLTLVPALAGGWFYPTDDGDYWRTYEFIAEARTYETADDPHLIYSASRAFGNFQKLLADLPGERLHETIPNFHHTPRRLAAFQQALAADVKGRASLARPEIDFVLQRQADTRVVIDLLERGTLPERITHNDTKLNNVLIDDRTRQGICVLDLDTVMPGTVLYDFGDAVRAGACTAAEDEPDLQRVRFDLERYTQLARGYLDAARDFLTPTEIEYLPFGGRLITLEQGIRFLTDYLNGDIYYKTQREHHNLERARTQLKLVAEMERQAARLDEIVQAYANRLASDL
jgi:hypothetical protein